MQRCASLKTRLQSGLAACKALASKQENDMQPFEYPPFAKEPLEVTEATYYLMDANSRLPRAGPSR